MRAHDLILIIDMQNVYLPGQPWGCETFYRSCGRIRTLLCAAASRTDTPDVCFTVFASDPNAAGMWAEYNKLNQAVNADPWLSEIVDDLKPCNHAALTRLEPRFSAKTLEKRGPFNMVRVTGLEPARSPTGT